LKQGLQDLLLQQQLRRVQALALVQALVQVILLRFKQNLLHLERL
jgi:hypothetical protein